MAAKTQFEPMLVDLRDACRILNCSRTTVDKLVADGTIATATMGRKRVYRRADIENYAASLFGERT